MRASLLVALVSLIVPAAQQPLSPDAEGFIRNWLVLAPIAIVGESGATEIDRDFLGSALTSGGGTDCYFDRETGEVLPDDAFGTEWDEERYIGYRLSRIAAA